MPGTISIVRGFDCRNRDNHRFNPCRSIVAMQKSRLWSALLSGQANELESCLIEGADANEEMRGSLPLNAACDRQNVRIVDLLLKYGANPNARDDLGKSAMCCAVSMGNEELLRRLVEANGDPFATFECGNLIAVAVLWAGAEKMILHLVELGVDINAFNEDGFTALMLAIVNSDLSTVQALLDAGADVDLPDRCEGWTPLMHAFAHSKDAAAKLLMEAGARLDLKDKFGRTAEDIRGMGSV